MTKRIPTLDIAKGLGILLVVLGHNWAVLHEKDEVFRIIFSFHMPLFFFISGMLLKNDESFPKFLASRAQSLLKPYLATILLIGLIKAIKGKGFSAHYIEYITGAIYATGRTIEWVPLWFLPHLFVASCVAWLVCHYVRSFVVLGLLSFLSLVIGAGMLSHRDLAWSLDLAPLTVPFLILGYMSRDWLRSAEFKPTILFMVSAIFILLHYFFDVTMDLNGRIYDGFSVVTLQALAGIYISLGFSVLLARVPPIRSLLSYIGAGSLFILIFHPFFQGWTTVLLFRIFKNPLIPVVLGFLAGVFLPLVIKTIVAGNRFLTWIYLAPKNNALKKYSD